MEDRDKAISHLQILRTWATIDREHGRGINERECNEVVKWVDETLEVLKTLQPCNVIHRHNRSDGFYDGNCPLCGALLDSFYNHRFCGTCGQVVKWDD